MDGARKQADMGTIKALVDAHGEREVEFGLWGWAATLDAEMKDTVERALALDGVWGVEDLVLAGPALGGPDATQLAAAFAFVEAELSELAAA